MKILLASSEVSPFSKTRGLADVCGSLPRALHSLGHSPIVISPAYQSVFRIGAAIQPTEIVFDIPIGSKVVSGRLLESRLPGSEIPIYFVDQPEYFDRETLYEEHGEEFNDNCERFVFFNRAVLETIRLLDLSVDVLHCHDWQTGLIPAYLRIEYEHARGYEQIVSLMAIHSLEDQGQFWHWDMLLTGLDWKYFNWRQMEFWGKLNLLKTGLVFADAISTVSPQYAREIRTEPAGHGVAGVLQQRQANLVGIVNGVDEDEWNPATDPHLVDNYGPQNWQSAKARCKASLQLDFELPSSNRTPLIGVLGPLTDDKGWDLVSEVMQRWVDSVDCQWIILGHGVSPNQLALRKLANAFPHRVGARFEFSDRINHQLLAGVDLLLMPSRSEPCGVNQLSAMKYGTLPVVHAVGGLVDTVHDASPQNLQRKTATGFSFEEELASGLEEALRRAVALFQQEPPIWKQLVETAMQQDWSWERSGRHYVKLYEQMLHARLEQRSQVPASG